MKLLEVFEAPPLNEVVVVNPHGVREFVAGYADKVASLEAKNWFQKKLYSYLMNKEDGEDLS